TKADLGPHGVEVEQGLGQGAVEVEDHRARRRPLGHSPASGAPPLRATSVLRILSRFMPRARLVMLGKSSSSGGGSPFMKRSGLTRATTKLRRYGLVSPRALSPSTAAVTASSKASSSSARRSRSATVSASLPFTQPSTLRRIGW